MGPMENKLWFCGLCGGNCWLSTKICSLFHNNEIAAGYTATYLWIIFNTLAIRRGLWPTSHQQKWVEMMIAKSSRETLRHSICLLYLHPHLSRLLGPSGDHVNDKKARGWGLANGLCHYSTPCLHHKSNHRQFIWGACVLIKLDVDTEMLIL